MTSEAQFLSAFFEELDRANTNYCVLRNYETLPFSLGGSDLDLLVLANEREHVADLLVSVAARYGGRVISEYATTGRYMKLLGCFDGEWWGAAVDLMPGLDYRGVVYLEAPPVIARSEDFKGIRVASAADADMIALIKELLNNGRTRKRYLPNAVAAYREYGKSALEVVRASFGRSFADEFERWLGADSQDPTEISSMATRMRRAVKTEHGAGQRWSALYNFWRRMRRIGFPPGVSIVITGTDGAGKTTVIDQIIPILSVAVHGKVQREHLRPNWLPQLGVAAGRRKGGEIGPVTEPHKKKPSGFIGSMLRLAYYWMDYTVGYCIRIVPRIVKRSHICIFDRYFHDIVLDPRRMRIALPGWILKCAFAFVPRPKLVICLGAAPEILYQRKPETSLQEVERQVKGLKRLAQRTGSAVWVDTAQPVEDTVNDVLRAIQSSMGNRYQ